MFLPQSANHMQNELDHDPTLPKMVHNDGDHVKNSSEEDEGSFRTEDGDDIMHGKKASKWHRMKWTDEMVKLLITVVSYIGEDYNLECSSMSKRKLSMLQKKGKWKLVSKVMAERGCFVFSAAVVVENPALLECMNHLSDKTKNLVRKILSSKHLFYEEMCSYHNGNRLRLKADPALLQSLKMALGSADQHNEDEIDEDNQGGDNDDRGLSFNKRMVHGVECKNPSVPQDCNRTNSFDMNQVLDEGLKGDWVQQEENLRSRSLKLEAKKLQMRVENERMKLENDQLQLVLKHQELKLRISSLIIFFAMSIPLITLHHLLYPDGCCRSCPVQSEHWIMPAELLVLRQLRNFDVVLGMDWLTRYYATIDCGARTIVFHEPRQEEFVYKGYQNTLFAMTTSTSLARQRMSSEYVAFLATVVEVLAMVPRLEDISVVREFPDVFSLELPGLPPDWKIEFVIDMVPGTVPISKALYRMAPAELRE
uniref:Uncharacterized protein n=1 Tax=Ananas comosus var. bracteatus TaxID=296719 RepID=A0A6V7NHD7_ANACO|nr:unnamed protein product [Ananas comosus var. bracteatus]